MCLKIKFQVSASARLATTSVLGMFYPYRNKKISTDSLKNSTDASARFSNYDAIMHYFPAILFKLFTKVERRW